ncbi:MAG: hypothetical protein GSR76_02210 [Desulfurococcales archaeon]|nr:hypothetical protein [Desulfurococcales archaeon]
MVSSLSLKLRDMLLEKGFQLLDIYRIHEKKGEEYIAIDELRVKDKQTGKVFLVKLDGPKEAMDPEKIVELVLNTVRKIEKEEEKEKS